jgi:hypothetical protein
MTIVIVPLAFINASVLPDHFSDSLARALEPLALVAGIVEKVYFWERDRGLRVQGKCD